MKGHGPPLPVKSLPQLYIICYSESFHAFGRRPVSPPPQDRKSRVATGGRGDGVHDVISRSAAVEGCQRQLPEVPSTSTTQRGIQTVVDAFFDELVLVSTLCPCLITAPACHMSAAISCRIHSLPDSIWTQSVRRPVTTIGTLDCIRVP
jgi:hypothetical protein